MLFQDGFMWKAIFRRNEISLPSREPTYLLLKALLKMMFLFSRWDMYGYVSSLQGISSTNHQPTTNNDCTPRRLKWVSLPNPSCSSKWRRHSRDSEIVVQSFVVEVAEKYQLNMILKQGFYMKNTISEKFVEHVLGKSHFFFQYDLTSSCPFNGKNPAMKSPNHTFTAFTREDMKLRGKLQRDFVDFVLRPLWVSWPYWKKGLKINILNPKSWRFRFRWIIFLFQLEWFLGSILIVMAFFAERSGLNLSDIFCGKRWRISWSFRVFWGGDYTTYTHEA